MSRKTRSRSEGKVKGRSGVEVKGLSDSERLSVEFIFESVLPFYDGLPVAERSLLDCAYRHLQGSAVLSPKQIKWLRDIFWRVSSGV